MQPQDVVKMSEAADYPSPMLGLVVAISLVRALEPDFAEIAALIAYLDGQLPNHPDVDALRLLATERLLELGTQREKERLNFLPPESVTWPPSVAATYDSLIELDASIPGVLRPETLGDRYCASRVRSTYWSSFVNLYERVPPSSAEAKELDHTGIDGLRISPEAPLEARLVGLFLARYGRVHGLWSVAELTKRLRIGTIAWCTSLTTAAVRRALNDTTPGTDWSDGLDFDPAGPSTAVKPRGKDGDPEDEDQEREKEGELVPA
jgi:hypothetical protein